MRGRLITLEGIDGAGKTTQARRIGPYLEAQGLRVQSWREPGGTPLGEGLRSLIKSGLAKSAASELLLFAAARAELVHELVAPALARGEWVLLDRFSDSSYAYQGALNLLPENLLRAVCEVAAAGLVPDLTLWLDLEPERARGRMAGEKLDAIEQRDGGYHERVRAAYEALWRDQPARIRRIEAGQPKEAVWAQIEAALAELLKPPA
jgi:dTMP kinase